jgi:cell division protease FtsH
MANKKPFKRFEFRVKIDPKKILIWILVLFFGFYFLTTLLPVSPVDEEIPLSQALNDIKNGQVEEIVVEEERIILNYPDKTLISTKESGESMAELLEKAGIDPSTVKLRIKNLSLGRFLTTLLEVGLPILFTIGLFYFLTRQAGKAQDVLFSFGKSRARKFAKGKQRITFADVGGVEEAKKELEEVVDFLKNPKKYRKLGARTPKGVLLIGPSGTGKTLLAKAVAGEANVPFFSMAGSEFMEMLVGVGASRVRDLFNTAKRTAPSIIFIDELDAIGGMRGMGIVGGHREQEQTLNQILVEIDGFTPNDHVIVLAATNRPDMLDPALTRPGRFDRRVVLDMPDINERKKILMIHSQGKPFVQDVDWGKVAKRTVGFSGADLENMLNEAAILAARNSKKAIDADDIEEAATKVKLGPEKKRLQSKSERKMTAYHEAGHAVVAHYLPTMDPVHRVSIVSRGLALGFTLIPPEKDKYTETKTELLEKIMALLGGRAAEELVFQEFTGGAASDIDSTTRIVRKMVIEYGMSDLGPVYFGSQIDKMEWGGTFVRPPELSDQMQAKVDKEIKKIIDFCYQKAKEILKKHRKKLDLIAEKLVEQETIEGEEFTKLMGPRKTKD